MLKIIGCLSKKYDLVFLCHCIDYNSKFLPTVVQDDVEFLDYKTVILKILKGGPERINHEVEITKMIKSLEPTVLVPDILGEFILTSQDLNQYKISENFTTVYHKKRPKDYGRDGTKMIIFENIEGEYLTFDRAMENLPTIFTYIEKLHNLSIVHWDIKEDNFIDNGKEIYLIDFGYSFDYNYKTTNNFPPFADLEIPKNMHSLKDRDWNFVIEMLRYLKYDKEKRLKYRDMDRNKTLQIIEDKFFSKQE